MAHLAHPLARGLGGDGLPSGDIAREAQRDLWGEEILFDTDLQLAPNGDYVLVSGMAAVRQAIRIRLITRPGELPWAPEFGCGVLDYLGEVNTSSKLSELRGRIRDQLLQDPRLSSISAVEANTETINSQPVLKISIRAQAAGLDVGAEPFVFIGGA